MTPDSLIAAIHDLHAAIADHPDAQGKADLTKALQIAMQVQARDHQKAGEVGAAAQTVISQLGR